MSWGAALVESWWSWMEPLAVQLAVLGAIVAALDAALCRWACPRLLAALWLVVLVKLVLPPSLSSPLSLARWVDEAGPFWPSPGGSGAALRSLAFAAWAAGAAGLLALGAWRHRCLRRDWLGPRPAPAPEWLETLSREQGALIGLRRPPALRVCRGAAGPALVGLLRPVVVLPAELVWEGERRRLAHVLLHEFVHIRRRDPLAALAAFVGQAVFWFHPVLWIARRRLSILRELSCDQAVARILGKETAAYRLTLLELSGVSAPPPVGLGFLRRRARLLGRLERLERPLPGVLWSRIGCAGLLAVLFACCVPLARVAPPSLAPERLLEDRRGCLQLRYAVLGMLARLEDRAAREDRPADPDTSQEASP
jgi:beta-lactamase regulating signal transducer with metallopeptidase domain